MSTTPPQTAPDNGPEDSPDDSWRQRTGWRHLWSISWPVIVANITFPLVGAADTAMMGRLDDASFVGGVALGSLVFNFIYFGLGFLRMCTTGLVAQAHGRGDVREIENHLVRGLIIAFVLGVTFVLATPVVHVVTAALLSASGTVESLMRTYVGIRLFAVPAALANTVLLGCLFGRQQMRLVMVQIVAINLVNLCLNFLFVLGFGMAIEGVALASVVAQWVGLGLTLCLVGWFWRDILRGATGRIFRRRPAWLDAAALSRFFVIGGDITIRTVLILLSEAVLLNHAAELGDLSLAATQLILVIFGVIAFGLDGFAHAAEALVARRSGDASRRCWTCRHKDEYPCRLHGGGNRRCGLGRRTADRRHADIAARPRRADPRTLALGGASGAGRFPCLPDGRCLHRRDTEPRHAKRHADLGRCVHASCPGARRSRPEWPSRRLYDISRTSRHHPPDADGTRPRTGTNMSDLPLRIG